MTSVECLNASFWIIAFSSDSQDAASLSALQDHPWLWLVVGLNTNYGICIRKKCACLRNAVSFTKMCVPLKIEIIIYTEIEQHLNQMTTIPAFPL